VDVIKSGGYKISALDIEKELLGHPDIEDVAVMGLHDNIWGQRVFSLIVLKEHAKNGIGFVETDFRSWCSKRLPKYSVPTIIKIVDKMPRNIMGKVNKKEIIKFYQAEK
jgi:malonyl-CoA/methylmalonyl-CoA synthetase